MLRDAAELLAPAVEQTIATLTEAAKIGDAEAGAVQLARRYAAAIDGAARADELAELALEAADDLDINTRLYIQALAAKVEQATLLEKLGPKLQAVLDALEATPAARHRAKGGKPADAPPSKLAALRAADARSDAS